VSCELRTGRVARTARLLFFQGILFAAGIALGEDALGFT